MRRIARRPLPGPVNIVKCGAVVLLVCLAASGFLAANVLATARADAPSLGTTTPSLSVTLTTPVTTITARRFADTAPSAGITQVRFVGR